MKSGFCLTVAFAAIAMLQASMVCASGMKIVDKADNKDDFAAVVIAVHQQMKPGGRYDTVDAAGKAAIEGKFSDMQSLFDVHATVAAMNETQKVQLFNDQEAVNAILTKNDGDRLICESAAPTGSLIRKTTCRRYSDIQRDRLDIQHQKDQMMQINQMKGDH